MKITVKVFISFLIFLNVINLYAAGDNLAILDFRSNGVPSFFGKAVSDVMVTELKKYNDYTIIERSQIDIVLKEKKMNGAAENIHDSILIGEMLKADVLLLGSISKIGEKYNISAKIVDVKSGSVSAADSETCYVIDDIDKASRVLAVRLLNGLTEKDYNLPVKNYRNKTEFNNFELSMNYRYGIVHGFEVPAVTVPEVYGEPLVVVADAYEFTYQCFNFEFLWLATENIGFFSNFGIILSKEFELHRSAKIYDEDTADSLMVYYQGEDYPISYKGIKTGLGSSFILPLGRASLFLNASINYTHLLAKEEILYNIGILTYSGGQYASDDYDVIYDSDIKLITAEFTPGIKISLSEICGVNLSVGLSRLIYGSYFQNLKIKKKWGNENTDPPYADMDKNLSYEVFEADVPIDVYFQVGAFFRL